MKNNGLIIPIFFYWIPNVSKPKSHTCVWRDEIWDVTHFDMTSNSKGLKWREQAITVNDVLWWSHIHVVNTLNFAEPRTYAVNRALKPGVMVCTFGCHWEIFHRACCLACSLVSVLQAFLLQMEARCKMFRASDADFLPCSMCRVGIVFYLLPLHIAGTDKCYYSEKLFPSGCKLCSC
jgi:hypothetical protein